MEILVRLRLEASDGLVGVLRALVLALSGGELDRRREGADRVLPSGVPGPSPVVVAGPPVPPPSPAAPADGDRLADWDGLAAVEAEEAAAFARVGRRGRRMEWRTEARAELMRRDWRDAGVSIAGMRARMAALPGEPVPTGASAIYAWAAALGLGGRGLASPRHMAGLAAAAAARGARAAAERAGAVAQVVPPVGQSVEPAPAVPAGGGYRSAARLAVLARDFPAGVPSRDIVAAMNALPGPPVPAAGLSGWARERGLERPAGWDWRSAAAARAPGAARGARTVAGVGWDEILAWAETVDPDLVLRGSPEDRLGQINELRALEGVPAFRLPVAGPARGSADAAEMRA